MLVETVGRQASSFPRCARLEVEVRGISQGGERRSGPHRLSPPPLSPSPRYALSSPWKVVEELTAGRKRKR